MLGRAVGMAMLGVTLVGCEPRRGTEERGASADQEAQTMSDRVVKSEDQWRCELTPQQYHVTREKGTERAFTGEYWNHHGDGNYVCVACGQELFDSQTKFDSGTGWPSFTAPANVSAVGAHVDRSYGMTRTEVHCSRCGAHLGHVFDDGPGPDGMRYCINSCSLKFAERKQPASRPAEPPAE